MLSEAVAATGIHNDLLFHEAIKKLKCRSSWTRTCVSFFTNDTRVVHTHHLAS
jgi:hypothetical protein